MCVLNFVVIDIRGNVLCMHPADLFLSLFPVSGSWDFVSDNWGFVICQFSIDATNFSGEKPRFYVMYNLNICMYTCLN